MFTVDHSSASNGVKCGLKHVGWHILQGMHARAHQGFCAPDIIRCRVVNQHLDDLQGANKSAHVIRSVVWKLRENHINFHLH